MRSPFLRLGNDECGQHPCRSESRRACSAINSEGESYILFLFRFDVPARHPLQNIERLRSTEAEVHRGTRFLEAAISPMTSRRASIKVGVSAAFGISPSSE
ncbi:hypothetical protein TNCV_923071 [Trichonephila clavipes]|nr:hypothetical protein TNCV_923071 [Trichonephila clavipes]